MKTLDEWLAWQSGLHPKAVELGLERVAAVWGSLGHKALPCPVVTVGGTNGKGSCAAMIESMARAAGYRVGLYTSPHLLLYNERVRIGGESVDDPALCAAFERIELARTGLPLTYFEYGTLAALDLFQRAGLDLAVLEVGLGGRLDAVNLIDADVGVVTGIGRDHTQWLGESLDAIALEKAGIFRPGRVAIIGQPDAPPVLRQEAERVGARVLQVGKEIGVAAQPAGGGWTWCGPESSSGTGTGGERLALPAPAMRGLFQYRNAAAAVAALRALRERLPVPAAALRAGLLSARLPGRFQVFPGEVPWILDVAHNPQAAETLASNVRAYPCRGRLRAVLAVLADKEPEGIAGPLIDLVQDWYLSQSADPRAMAVETLGARLAEPLAGRAVRTTPDLDAALGMARGDSVPGDCILVYGSFTTVAAALVRLGGNGETGILAR